MLSRGSTHARRHATRCVPIPSWPSVTHSLSFDQSIGELPSLVKVLSITTPDIPRRFGPLQIRLLIAHKVCVLRKYYDTSVVSLRLVILYVRGFAEAAAHVHWRFVLLPPHFVNMACQRECPHEPFVLPLCRRFRIANRLFIARD